MRIALDVSPLENSGRGISHRVRGIGFYIENLKRSLLRFYPEHSYIFFSDTRDIRGKVDVVHFPYFEPFFLSLPIWHSVNRVVTVHDLTPLVFPDKFPHGLRGRIKWEIQKMSLKKTNAIIADSQSTKDDIISFTNIPSEKIHVVYLAASDEFKKLPDGEWNADIRKKYGLPEVFVLYVGDVTWNKNVPRLLKAMIKIQVPLVMVGGALVRRLSSLEKGNPWNQDHEIMEKLTENNRLVLKLGFLPTDDLVKLYNMATVFIMPSLYEGFGLPVLEAMACGTAVITSKRGSLHEVASEAACYIEPEDENDIVKGVSKILSDKKLREKLSQKGLVQRENFTWEKTAAKTMQVYEGKS